MIFYLTLQKQWASCPQFSELPSCTFPRDYEDLTTSLYLKPEENKHVKSSDA